MSCTRVLVTARGCWATRACIPALGLHWTSPTSIAGTNVQLGVPKRQYTIEELRLNKIDAPKIISPTDTSLNTARSLLQVWLRLSS